MGDRGQVKIGKVYLYTHWGGSNLKEDVKTALAKRWRWEDDEYLARIIFDVMTHGQNGEETGFGIGTSMHGDLNNPLVEVDCDKREVRIEKKKWSFEEFIGTKNMETKGKGV